MKFLDRLSVFLIYLIIFLLITGGWEYSFNGGRVELSQINLFGITLMLLYIISIRGTQIRSAQKINAIVEWGTNSSVKKSMWLLIAVMGMLFIGRLLRHWTLNTSLVDVTCVHQPLFNLFSPSLMHSDANWNGTQLAGHMTWIFVPVGLLIGWTKSDLVVFVFKFAIVSSSIWIFLTQGPLGKFRQVWFWFLFIIFASKALKNGMLFDFREDEIAFAAFLMAGLSLYRGSWKWYWASLITALLCKENIPPVAATLAIPILFDKELPFSWRERKIHSAFTIGISVIYGFAIFKWIIPWFMGDVEVHNNLITRFPGMGESTREVVLNVLFRPDLVVKNLLPNVFTLSALEYLFFLFGPFIYWARHKLIWIVPAVPGVMMNLLSSAETQRMMVFHYEFIIICFLIIAAAFGMARTIKNNGHSKIAVSVLIALCFFDRPPLYEARKRLVEHGYRLNSSPSLKSINVDEPIGTTHNYWAHLSHLKALRLINFPQGELPDDEISAIHSFVNSNPVRTMADEGRDPADAKWVIFDMESPWGRWLKDQMIRRNLLGDSSKITEIYELHSVKNLPFEDWCKEFSACRK